MKQSVSVLRPILRINGMLLYSFVLGGVSWLSWPQMAEEWRWGIIAFFCGLSCLALCFKAIGEIWDFVRRDITVSGFNKKGREARQTLLHILHVHWFLR